MPRLPQCSLSWLVDGINLRAFGVADELYVRDFPWHEHHFYQVLYAVRGTLHLETEMGWWLLPPMRAAFIPAHLKHRVRPTEQASLRTLYLSAEFVTLRTRQCGVFTVTPLAREMILYAMRWGPDHSPGDALAARFFTTLGALLPEWLETEVLLALPRARTSRTERAMTYTLRHLETATVTKAAAAAHTSVRTLTRHFRYETGLSWRTFLRTARIVRAVELLSAPTASVSSVSLAVGFESLSAFSSAFKSLVGESPSHYQKKLSRDTSRLS